MVDHVLSPSPTAPAATSAGVGTVRSQPVLPIHKVQTRSIDAKTIADRYNKGLPRQEDYLFGGARKFYQRDDN